MAINREGVVLYFVNDVDLVRSAEVDLLGRDSGCTNFLKTTDFVVWGEVAGLAWILRVLALCKSGPEGTSSRCTWLDEVVNATGLKGGVPFLPSGCSNRRKDEGGYYKKRRASRS